MAGGILQDLRFAWRGLLTAPLVALGAALILAVGAGLTTTIVGLAYGILIRPLPYPDPSSLLLVTVGDRHGADAGMPLSAVEAWQARLRSVGALGGYSTTQYTLRGVGEPQVVQAALVTDGFFDVLRPSPLRGRLFGRSEAAVLLSERVARDLGVASNGDPLGTTVTIANLPFTVVGILTESAAFPSERVGVWLPARDMPPIELTRHEDERRFRLIARMRPGVRMEQVRDDARRVLQVLRSERPETSGQLVASVEALRERLVAPARPVLLVFSAGAILVLLVASANAGGLLLARSVSRERDMAVRLAVGAARNRLVRTVFAEALLVAVVGGALGVALAVWAARTLRTLAEGALPRLHEVAIDWPVLLASLATAGLVTVLCGMAPALHALRTDVAPALRQGSGSRARGARRLAGALAAAQIAASVALLIAAGLLTRTVIGLLRTEVGIQPRHALATTLLLSDRMGFDAADRRSFIRHLTHELHRLPGVRHAGLGSSCPPASSLVAVEFTQVSDGGRAERSGLIELAAVTPGYFDALGIPLIAGRTLEERDADAAYPVAVISQSVARKLFASDTPLGRTLPGRLPGTRRAAPEIVGVVGDVKYDGLDAPAGGTIYVPWEDLPSAVVSLAVRTAGDPLAIAPQIRRVIHQVDPGQPVGAIRPMEDVIAGAVSDRRVRALLVSSFGAIALVLAVSGLVAGLARGVNERRRELAIRSALGASPARTVGHVLAEGGLVLALGLGAGIVTAALAADAMAALIHGLSPRDPLTYAAAAAVVAVTGMVGCYVPARRAAAVSPAELLRSE